MKRNQNVFSNEIFHAVSSLYRFQTLGTTRSRIFHDLTDLVLNDNRPVLLNNEPTRPNKHPVLQSLQLLLSSLEFDLND